MSNACRAGMRIGRTGSEPVRRDAKRKEAVRAGREAEVKPCGRDAKPHPSELSELFSGFRNQVVLSVDQTAKNFRKNP